MNELAIKQAKTLAFIDDDGLCKYDEKGIIKRVQYTVTLKQSLNHFCGITISNKTTWFMTAEGFEHLNKYANLQTIKEDNFKMNGKEYSNPYVVFDTFGNPVQVIAKHTLIGYDNTGTIQISPAIVIYNASSNMAAAILKKIQYMKDADKPDELAYLSTVDGYKEDKEKNKSLVFYPIDEFTGVVLNLKNREALKIYSTQKDKLDNIISKAQTVARRNAFRRHPATSMYTIKPTQLFNSKQEVIDIAYQVKISTWLNANDDTLKATIENYLNSNEDASNYSEQLHEADPDFDPEDGMQNIDDDYEIVDKMDLTEEQAKVKSENADDLEKANRIKWIEEAASVIGGDVAKYVKSQGDLNNKNLTELSIVMNEIKTMEEKNND